MNAAVRDCLVSGYEPLIEGLKLPDPGDRNVLAAAIKSGAQVIVTRNLKHFPASDLESWDIEFKSPDAFVLDQVGINGRAVAASVRPFVIPQRLSGCGVTGRRSRRYSW
jgi:hypothetical protein